MKRAKQQLFENNKHSVLVVDELTKKYGKFLKPDEYDRAEFLFANDYKILMLMSECLTIFFMG